MLFSGHQGVQLPKELESEELLWKKRGSAFMMLGKLGGCVLGAQVAQSLRGNHERTWLWSQSALGSP